MPERVVSVSLPTDDRGMLPRQCPHCQKHFSIGENEYASRAHINLRCPYCKWIAELSDFTTEEQHAYARAVGKNEALRMAEEAVAKSLKEAFSGLRSSKHVKFEMKGDGPKFGREGVPSPFPPVQLAQVNCGACAFPFGVLSGEEQGASCPVCR